MTPPTHILAVKQPVQANSIYSRIGRYMASVILMAVDYMAVVLAILTAWYLRAVLLPYHFPTLPPFHINNTYVYFVFPLTYFLFLAYEGMYKKRLPFWKSVEILFKICAYVSALAIVVMYFTGKAENISRAFIGLTWFFSFIYLISTRYVTKRILVGIGLWQKPVVIVGAGKTAEILAKSFEDEPNLGYKIIGLVEDNYVDRPLIHKYPHIGGFANVEQAVINSRVQDVIIATPGLAREEMLNLVYRIQPYVRNLTIVPDLFGVPLSNMEVETLYNEKTVMLKARNNLSLFRNRFIKRLFDVVTGIFIFSFISPVLVVLYLAVKYDSQGPALHVARRLGKNGEEFLCYKFRTMHVNADNMLEEYFQQNPEAKEEWDKFAKLKNDDPRVTKAGKWLRKYSLDELPQIVNVLIGNMSLVGPRPYLPREKARMGYLANTILETVPGITGLWQVSGRNEIEFEGRLQLDSWYVRNWSVWHDMVLLLKTVNVVLGRKGAY
ncbi:undecaprenyl-phosphate galactose phosphotransferase WbaP [Pelosinus fermentans]|uniref:Undecaprenyl-phosphate galactose phosphotransferase, WbaP n=1 Tax=Pelosinus fermentans JBW45 TaxID=1192197 RepID=I8TVZ3_9FIRM|nr:undecaprenyl-phosphate galactose phosphotransferase WbaP [Pelosinus fermentans]AJQ26011.1 Undecaprenyl-phosphate galactose phosphotransferase, WbaP [Pelosinus fermentans JBW45]